MDPSSNPPPPSLPPSAIPKPVPSGSSNKTQRNKKDPLSAARQRKQDTRVGKLQASRISKFEAIGKAAQQKTLQNKLLTSKKPGQSSSTSSDQDYEMGSSDPSGSGDEHSSSSQPTDDDGRSVDADDQNVQNMLQPPSLLFKPPGPKQNPPPSMFQWPFGTPSNAGASTSGQPPPNAGSASTAAMGVPPASTTGPTAAATSLGAKPPAKSGSKNSRRKTQPLDVDDDDQSPPSKAKKPRKPAFLQITKAQRSKWNL
ncbi:hypothetical protein K435DRAFT_805754, partial [Dendrothele bispora CBS 962.96]